MTPRRTTRGTAGRPAGDMLAGLRSALERGETPLERWVFVGLLLWILWATTYLAPGAQSVAAAGFAVFCLDVVLNRRALDGGGSVGLWLLVALGMACLSTLTSIWLGPSVAYVQRLTLNILFFVFVVNALRRPSQTRVAILVILVLLALFPARGAIWEYIAVGGRVDWKGLFGAPNDLAAALVLFVPLAVAWRRCAERFWARRAAEGAVLLLIGAILVTGSRSGSLALLLVAGWVVWTSRRRLRLLLVGLGCLLVVGATGSLQVTERVGSMFAYGLQGRAASLEGEELSNWTSRKRIWGVAMDAVWDRPVLGMGPGTFEEVHSRLADATVIGGGARWQDTHNSFLRIWSEMGTLGLIAFLGVWSAAFIRGRQQYVRGRRDLGGHVPEVRMLGACMVGLAAFLVSNLFNTFYHFWLMYFVIGLIVVLSRHVEEARRRARPAARPSRAPPPHLRRVGAG